MLISARQAAAVLAEVGVTRRQARTVLAAGLAGPPIVTRSAHLYDASRVRKLSARPELGAEELDAADSGWMFVARREIDVTAPYEQQLTAVEAGWDLHWTTLIRLRIRISQRGFVPLLGTVCGFVVLAAEIVDAGFRGHRDVALTLREAGEWRHPLLDRRLRAGPGRDHVVRGWTDLGPVAAVEGSRRPVGESLPYPMSEETA